MQSRNGLEDKTQTEMYESKKKHQKHHLIR